VDAEVAIVGGSVAGCATALHLAARGHRVVVFDRAAFPREKVCGEGLMPHGLSEIAALGLEGQVRETGGVPFDGIGYHLDGVAALGTFARGTGLGVRRYRLDEVFVNACRSAERVTFRAETSVRRVSWKDSQALVEFDGGELSCRVVIGADGLQSGVRRWAGLSSSAPKPHRYGLRAHFRLPSDKENVPRVEVHVGKRVEYYLTPVAPDEVNVAVLMAKPEALALKGAVVEGTMHLLEQCPAVWELICDAERVTQPKVCGPLRQDVPRLVAAGVVLVGDAAGFVDAITGEGMSIALVSARLAAEAVSNGLATGDVSAKALAVYESNYRAEVRDPSRLTRLLVWGIRNRWLARRVVLGLSRNPQVFRQILAVNCGQAPLSSIGPLGLLRLLW
jgi:menaquinone-9 beta-reductase